MHTASFGIEDRVEILHTLRAVGFGHLVTHSIDADGVGQLNATAIPFLVDDELIAVRAHVARANAHWKSIDGVDALLIVPGADTYISPRWYPSKAEHQRVVPTSNYELAHVRGTVSVRHDAAWKLALIRELTDVNECRVSDPVETQPWSVDDAPDDFVEKQLKAIVGIELTVADVQLKRKMSQNKSDADRHGAVAGLRRTGDSAALVAADMMESAG